MRIAVVTCYEAANFGSYLQAFGMKKLIENSGNEAVFVKTTPYLTTLLSFLGYDNSKPSRSCKAFFSRVKHWVRYPKQFFDGISKYRLYKKDIKQFKIITIRQCKKNPPELMIFGSDELWNVRKPFFRDARLFGVGMPALKKAAFAISIGDMELEDWDKYPFVLPAINSLSAVYCRDSRTEDIIKRAGGGTNGIVADPTVQSDIRRYMRDCRIDKLPKEPFILIYSYNIQPEIVRNIRRFADEKGLKIASVSLFQSWCDYYINCSPLEFGFVLSKAEYVYTTTFHGSIFSTLYHTRFACKPISPKVVDVLTRFGVECALLSENPSYEEFYNTITQERDYDKIEENINNMRTRSLSAFFGLVKEANE